MEQICSLRGTINKILRRKNGYEIYEHKVYAAFELMESWVYFCFHDRDIAPEAQQKNKRENLERNRSDYQVVR